MLLTENVQVKREIHFVVTLQLFFWQLGVLIIMSVCIVLRARLSSACTMHQGMYIIV